MSALPTDVNPADVAIEMLTEALPGFESRFVGSRDAVGIRGALPIAAEVSAETIMWPIYRRPVFMDVAARNLMDALETDEHRAIRHARQRETLLEELAPIINRIVESVQRLGIDALGLEPVIADRERRARESGRRDGYAEGRSAGIREGRVQVLAELEEVRERLIDIASEMKGAGDE